MVADIIYTGASIFTPATVPPLPRAQHKEEGEDNEQGKQDIHRPRCRANRTALQA